MTRQNRARNGKVDDDAERIRDRGDERALAVAGSALKRLSTNGRHMPIRLPTITITTIEIATTRLV